MWSIMPETDSDNSNCVCKLFQPKGEYSIYGSPFSLVSEFAVVIKK